MSILSQFLPARLFTRTQKDTGAKAPLDPAIASPTKKRKLVDEAGVEVQEPSLPEPVTPDQKMERSSRSKKARRVMPELRLADLPEDLLRVALGNLSCPADLTAAGTVWPAQEQVRAETLAVQRPVPRHA